MEFPRQEHWGGLPFLSPGDLPDSGIESRSPALWADSFHLSHQGSSSKKKNIITEKKKIQWEGVAVQRKTKFFKRSRSHGSLNRLYKPLCGPWKVVNVAKGTRRAQVTKQGLQFEAVHSHWGERTESGLVNKQLPYETGSNTGVPTGSGQPKGRCSVGHWRWTRVEIVLLCHGKYKRIHVI